MMLKKISFLSANSLKIIALISMTIDHIGLIFFPENLVLRAIGRLAFPIFAYFIAEGAKHTSNYLKYFVRIFGLGIIFFIFYLCFMKMVYFSIFITFSISLILIGLYKLFIKSISEKNTILGISYLLISAGLILLSYFLTTIAKVDYGIFGILISVILYAFKKDIFKMIGLFVMLLIFSFANQVFPIYINVFCIISVLLLMLYNGEKGKLNLKYLFYFYYPLHLVTLYGIYILINAF